MPRKFNPLEIKVGTKQEQKYAKKIQPIMNKGRLRVRVRKCVRACGRWC